MKVMVIRLGFLFLLMFSLLFALNFASAININFDFPEKVYQNTEFNVEIKDVDVSGILDVKIYVVDGTGKIASDIYASKWQSSNYYVKSAYPSQTVYRLIVGDYTGSGQICVKLRQAGKSSAIGEVCRGIEIMTKEESLIHQKEESIVINNNETASSDIIENVPASDVYEEDKPIILENTKKYSTSYYSNRVLLIYGFVVLCVIIIILLSLRIL